MPGCESSRICALTRSSTALGCGQEQRKNSSSYRYLLDCCGQGTVVYPSLVFGRDGRSTQFFLNLAALPVQVDFGLPRNLQPVHVDEVAHAVVAALTAPTPARAIEYAGTHAVSIPENFAALRTRLGLRPAAPVRLKVSLSWGRSLFTIGGSARLQGAG